MFSRVQKHELWILTQSEGPVSQHLWSRKSAFWSFMMPSISVTQTFLLLAFIHATASLPVRNEAESFLTQVQQVDTPWFLASSDPLLETEIRRLFSAGLERRRQLGDIEFSNRYAEFLRSKAKHSSICTFLRRVQGVRKSAVGGDLDKVNLLLKQYMCPSMYNSWALDL
ncbi:uncharacterized protein ACNS7B_006612 [Menidia menidia]